MRSGDKCRHPVMKADSEVPKHEDGSAAAWMMRAAISLNVCVKIVSGQREETTSQHDVAQPGYRYTFIYQGAAESPVSSGIHLYREPHQPQPAFHLGVRSCSAGTRGAVD